jgi:glycerol-3-phosphate acyltransferase PlsX
VTIAVDVMGGDLGPAEMVAGAMDAAREYGSDLILVGDERVIQEHLRALGVNMSDARVQHASESISMDEEPMQAVRHKRDSSLVVAARLVRDGSAQALVSAGSTGAVVATGPLIVRRLPGVLRPALGTPVPTTAGPCVLLDVGANPECRPEHLLQFAIMGAAYSTALFGIERPRVALLNNGTEEIKGNSLTVAAYRLLSDADLNFVGNVEGRGIPFGEADVVVSDGFTGNIALKCMEGVGLAIFDMIRAAVRESLRSKIGGLMLKPALRGVGKRLDYAEYGGGPLLGLAGLVVKAHGSSNRRAFKSAIRVAGEALTGGIVDRMRAAFAPQAGT